MIGKDRIRKSIVSVLFCITVISSVTGLLSAESVLAATVLDSGSCGPNLKYTLYSNGLLDITGKGKMQNYNYLPAWHDYKKKIKEVHLPSGLTEISEDAFNECRSLKSIDIPEGVKKIGSHAFVDCYSLTSISIPKSVTTIPPNAFSGCSSLTKVTLPNSVTYLGDGAFSGCSSLTSLKIPPHVKRIRSGAFAGCSSLTSITVPDSVTELGYRAFHDCSSAKSITIPDSVTYLGDYAFSGCSSLTSLKIPPHVKKIGSMAFSHCRSLKSITIPDSVTEIDEYAFAGCSSLTNITIPNSIKRIAPYTFEYCTSLKSITISEGVTSIGEGAFQYCSSIKNIIIPGHVLSVDDYAFSDCKSLTTVVIEEGTKSIGLGALDSEYLKSMTVPRSVTNLRLFARPSGYSYTIYGYAGSHAEEVAKDLEIPFVPISKKSVKSIKLDKTSSKVLTTTSDPLPGQSDTSLKLTATVLPSDATYKRVKWTSSNNSIASVDPSGRVRGLKPGTVTITATTVDGGKKATCKIQVMTRKETTLKVGDVYIFKSKLSNSYSMDVMFANSANNSNVSLYKTDTKRAAEKFTIEKKVVKGKTWYLLTRKNKYVGNRAVTELKGKNIVFAANKGTNWQLFRAFKFNDGTVQFINRGSNKAIAVTGTTAASRANVAPAKADLSVAQRWTCVKVG